MNRLHRIFVILIAVAAIGASLITSPASASQTPVGEIQQSFAAPCEDIAQTRSQFAHRIGVQKKYVRSTPNSCELSYAGPKIPDFEVGKDEIVCTIGACVGYGQRFHHSNDFVIRWLPSMKAFFAVDCDLVVFFNQLENYIRLQGNVSYYAGEFWTENGTPQDVLYYSGPKRPFVVPLRKLVELPSGRIFSPCYYFPGGKPVAEGERFAVKRVRDFR